jgi:hypothetical protein
LIELGQSTSDINRNTKGNILHGAMNPIASAKQTMELPGAHAKIQAHATLPSIYINLEGQDVADPSQQSKTAPQPWDRFHIVKTQIKQDKRIVGDIKIAVYGKVSQEQKFVPATGVKLTGNWVKITPQNALSPGEYAVVEMLGGEGMNLYVWDFGVNPSASANATALNPDAVESAPPQKPAELQKRP